MSPNQNVLNLNLLDWISKSRSMFLFTSHPAWSLPISDISLQNNGVRGPNLNQTFPIKTCFCSFHGPAWLLVAYHPCAKTCGFQGILLVFWPVQAIFLATFAVGSKPSKIERATAMLVDTTCRNFAKWISLGLALPFFWFGPMYLVATSPLGKMAMYARTMWVKHQSFRSRMAQILRPCCSMQRKIVSKGGRTVGNLCQCTGHRCGRRRVTGLVWQTIPTLKTSEFEFSKIWKTGSLQLGQPANHVFLCRACFVFSACELFKPPNKTLEHDTWINESV